MRKASTPKGKLPPTSSTSTKKKQKKNAQPDLSTLRNITNSKYNCVTSLRNILNCRFLRYEELPTSEQRPGDGPELLHRPPSVDRSHRSTELRQFTTAPILSTHKLPIIFSSGGVDNTYRSYRGTTTIQGTKQEIEVVFQKAQGL